MPNRICTKASLLAMSPSPVPLLHISTLYAYGQALWLMPCLPSPLPSFRLGYFLDHVEHVIRPRAVSIIL